MNPAARIAGTLAAIAALIAGIGPDAQAEPGVSDGLGRAATLAVACSGCHARDGNAIADLGGRSADQLGASLAAYRAEASGTSVMHRIARGYSPEDIRLIAAYLAAQPDH